MENGKPARILACAMIQDDAGIPRPVGSPGDVRDLLRSVLQGKDGREPAASGASPGDDDPAFEEIATGIESVLKGNADRFEMRCTRPGRRGDLRVRLEADPAATGRAALVVEELPESETGDVAPPDLRFQRLIENSSDIITIVDTDGSIRYESPAGPRVLGYETESRVGRFLFDFVHPEDLGHVVTAFTQALQRPAKTFALEYRCRDRSGAWRILEGTVKNLLIDPSIAGVVVNAREITGKKRAEEVQKRLTVVMDASPDLVGTADPHGRLSYLNLAGRRLLGLDVAGFEAGVNLTDVHPAWANELLADEGIPAALETGVWTGETALLGPTGAEVPILESILAHRNSDGTLAFLSIIGRDVSERRLLETELRQAQRLEAIGHLAAGIAHEINTPIQYLGDNIRFLAEAFTDVAELIGRYEEFVTSLREEGAAPEAIGALEDAARDLDIEYVLREFPRAVEQSLEGVKNVTAIVRAMKEFSHPGTGERTLTDINHAVEATLTVARSEWKYVAEVEKRFDPFLPMVECLPGDFNQALLNIIVNAAHAIGDFQEGSGKLGRIEIATVRTGENVEIRIRDTGGGIPEAIRDHIYDPFFTTKEVGRGTGQGLPIARNIIVEKHGGSLHFETEMGVGTTFVIRLPIDWTHEAREAAA